MASVREKGGSYELICLYDLLLHYAYNACTNHLAVNCVCVFMYQFCYNIEPFSHSCAHMELLIPRNSTGLIVEQLRVVVSSSGLCS